MTTTTADLTLQDLLDQANLNTLADALHKVKLGHMFSRVKATVVALTATATPDVTTAAVKAAATISGITLATGESLVVWNLSACGVSDITVTTDE